MATTKKTNAVVPPVVEGETFTSLQIAKDLGSDVSMETKLRLLYKLQQTDTKIDKIYLLRGELPLEVQDLEDSIEGLKTRIANLEKDIKDGEAFVAQKKQDIISGKALIEKYEAQRNNVTCSGSPRSKGATSLEALWKTQCVLYLFSQG